MLKSVIAVTLIATCSAFSSSPGFGKGPMPTSTARSTNSRPGLLRLKGGVSPSEPKLSYFDARGVAETARVLITPPIGLSDFKNWGAWSMIASGFLWWSMCLHAKSCLSPTLFSSYFLSPHPPPLSRTKVMFAAAGTKYEDDRYKVERQEQGPPVRRQAFWCTRLSRLRF